MVTRMRSRACVVVGSLSMVGLSVVMCMWYITFLGLIFSMNNIPKAVIVVMGISVGFCMWCLTILFQRSYRTNTLRMI